MKVTLLGTGTSQGVPVIGCHCQVCRSTDMRDKRLRTSCMIEDENTRVVIDTGPDFRQQMLSNQVDHIDAVLLTHEHKDHVGGLDDVRSFNFITRKAMPLYAEQRVMEAIKREFAYVFAANPYPGIPRLELHCFDEIPFQIGSLLFQPIRAFHHKLPVYGFRVNNFAYLTDVKSIQEPEFEKLVGLDVLVINALRIDPHISHLNLYEALQIIERIRPQKTFFTHLSHLFGLHAEMEPVLAEGVFLGYDNLIIEL